MTRNKLFLRVEMRFEVVRSNRTLHAIRRDVGFCRPQDRVQDDLTKILVAPVTVKMPAGKAETATAVFPLDHYDLIRVDEKATVNGVAGRLWEADRSAQANAEEWAVSDGTRLRSLK